MGRLQLYVNIYDVIDMKTLSIDLPPQGESPSPSKSMIASESDKQLLAGKLFESGAWG
jgi:hypothetical protein